RVEQYGAQAVKVRFRAMKDHAFVFDGQDFTTIINPGVGFLTQYNTIYSAAGSWRQIPSALDTQGYENLKIRKDDRYLELIGCCHQGTYAPSQVICVLPDIPITQDGQRLRPLRIQSIVVPLLTGASGASPVNWLLVSIDQRSEERRVGKERRKQ